MMENQPQMAGPMPQQTEMSISEAMDTLDEFGISEADYDRVMAAMEMVFSGQAEPEPPGEMEADDASELQSSANEMFATSRNRAEMR